MLESTEVAKDLYKKINELFPEFQPFLSEGDEENPTVTLMDLIDSLRKANASPNDLDLRKRLETFRDWAENYPRGNDSSNDIPTYYCVTFIEGMLEDQELYRFAPSIISKDSLIDGKEYFYTWIGVTEYHRALTAFPETED